MSDRHTNGTGNAEPVYADIDAATRRLMMALDALRPRPSGGAMLTAMRTNWRAGSRRSAPTARGSPTNSTVRW